MKRRGLRLSDLLSSGLRCAALLLDSSTTYDAGADTRLPLAQLSWSGVGSALNQEIQLEVRLQA